MSVIAVGDKFNAIVSKGPFSQNIIGEELAGKVAWWCPEVAIKVTPAYIETETSRYPRGQFTFVIVE